MQNRYAGDIGDYGKFGLLRSLGSTGFRIGVNWYLTPDETHNNDGRCVSYLQDDVLCPGDDELRRKLRPIVAGQRSVAALERAGLLDAVFYHAPLDSRAAVDRTASRSEWHANALDCLAGANLIFLDPDNGLMVPSAEGTVKENKYVKLSEIADYCRRNASVIWYQHKARRLDAFYWDQFQEILNLEDFQDMSGVGLKFCTVSQRYYFILMQPEHRGILSAQVSKFLDTPWKNHFSVLFR